LKRFAYFALALEKATCAHQQQPFNPNKLYSWHAPKVKCIKNGKAHKPYEFGFKVSIRTNVNLAPTSHLVLCSGQVKVDKLFKKNWFSNCIGLA
jgi:hypothetical protein